MFVEKLKKGGNRTKKVLITIKNKTIYFFKGRKDGHQISQSVDWNLEIIRVCKITILVYLVLVIVSKSPVWSLDEVVIEQYIHQKGRVPVNAHTLKPLTPDSVHINVRCIVLKHLNEALKAGFNKEQINRNELWLVKFIKACMTKAPRNCHGLCVNSFKYAKGCISPKLLALISAAVGGFLGITGLILVRQVVFGGAKRQATTEIVAFILIR